MPARSHGEEQCSMGTPGARACDHARLPEARLDSHLQQQGPSVQVGALHMQDERLVLHGQDDGPGRSGCGRDLSSHLGGGGEKGEQARDIKQAALTRVGGSHGETQQRAHGQREIVKGVRWGQQLGRAGVGGWGGGTQRGRWACVALVAPRRTRASTAAAVTLAWLANSQAPAPLDDSLGSPQVAWNWFGARNRAMRPEQELVVTCATEGHTHGKTHDTRMTET